MQKSSILGDGIWTFVVRLDSGYNQIGNDCYPQMGAHGILGVSPQGLHYNVLLDPFEENFNIPSVSVQASHFQCTDFEVVRNEYDFFFGFFIIDAYCAYRLWIEGNRLCGQANGRITSDATSHIGSTQFPVS